MLFGFRLKLAGIYLQKNAKQPTIGTIVDDAMDAIERDNRLAKGCFAKELWASCFG